MKKKLYKGFWDNFNTKLYETISQDWGVKDDYIKIRISSKLKKEYKEKSKFNGGMTNNITTFIKTFNEKN